MDIYEDLIQNHDAKLIAGGAAQNTARGAAVRKPSFSTMIYASLFYSIHFIHASPSHSPMSLPSLPIPDSVSFPR